MNARRTPTATAPRADALTLAQRVALLSGGDFWRTQALPEAGIGSAMMADGPHGLRVQLGAHDHLGLEASVSSTCFPTAVTLAGAWDEELAAEVGRALAIEARALGVDVVLGPGLNIKRHPCCGRNFEYFSEDPLLSGRMAAAMVSGLQDHGVGACLKHFAVNNQESHRFVVNAVLDERTLRELYLSGFEYAVTESRPWAVMAAYNKVNDESATQNRYLLTDVLRGEWGFDGLVVSDWAATDDRVAAVAAGMDLEMPSSAGISDADVLDAVADGRLPAELVTASAQRVLDLVERSRQHAVETTLVDLDVHHVLARRAAAEGSVLLVNDGVLPIAPERSVALVGAFAEDPRFQGNGSSQVSPTRITTVHDELLARDVTVTYRPGYDPATGGRDPELLQDAVEAARHADVAVVMVGLPPADECEGMDRTRLGLPAHHDELVVAVCEVNPRTVVVLSNGAPVSMPWKDAPAALLESYLGGQAGGAAVVDVLLGDVEPGGRLAETFPADLDDVAADPYFPGDPRQVEYREGLLVGYRHCTTVGTEPLFPFGHGLSYTTFRWEDARVDRPTVDAGDGVTVWLTVTNTGDRPGADVVQVYRHDRTGAVPRPRRELAGFTKVRLDPGERRVVGIGIPARAFAFYDVDSAGWRIPSGPFDLEVARSSADVVSTVSVQVTDGVPSSGVAGYARVAVDDAQFHRVLRRAVPAIPPTRPFTRQSTFGELRSTLPGRVLAAVFWRAAPIDDAARADPIASAVYRRGFDELPLRGTAVLSRGVLRWWAVDALLLLLNDHPVRAARHAFRPAARSVWRRVRGRSAGR